MTGLTTTILPLVAEDDRVVWTDEVAKGYSNEAVAKAAEAGTLLKLRGFVKIEILDTAAAETALHFEPGTPARKQKVEQANKIREAKQKQR